MAKGYQKETIKQDLVEILKNSKYGLSGMEISEKLGINRVTMIKYLKVFAAEGLVHQKNIGNTNLWFVQEGTEQFHFPEDYFKVKNKYLEYLLVGAADPIYSLIRNCIYSSGDVSKIISEIINPAIISTQELFNQGKIGKSEEKLLSGLISNSIQVVNLTFIESDPKKNAIILSADSSKVLQAEAASALFRANGWQVSSLGDMSASIDVIFDLDLKKFLSKFWKKKMGIMAMIIFSSTNEGYKFFSEAINSVKGTLGQKMFLILCGDIRKKNSFKADLIVSDMESALQWSETTFASQIS